jgi:hypothetical protein
MYTDQQLQALRDALANGVRRVRFGDREIEYRTVDELKQANHRLGDADERHQHARLPQRRYAAFAVA